MDAKVDRQEAGSGDLRYSPKGTGIGRPLSIEADVRKKIRAVDEYTSKMHTKENDNAPSIKAHTPSHTAVGVWTSHLFATETLEASS